MMGGGVEVGGHTGALSLVCFQNPHWLVCCIVGGKSSHYPQIVSAENSFSLKTRAAWRRGIGSSG